MFLFPAPRRSCAPLPLLASLTASLIACPASAQTHGTFQTGYSGGSVGANIVSTTGGPNTSSNTPQVTPFTAGSGQYAGGATVSADTDSGGGTNHCTAYIPDPNSANSPTLTATLTWKPDPSNPSELPPAALAMQTSNAFWTLLGADGGSTGGGSGLSNGLSNGVVGPNSNNTGQICNSTLYSVWTASVGAAAPISFPKTCNPTVNFAGTSGSQEHAAAAGSIGDTYTATAFPIFLSAPDPKGHPELGDGTNQFTYGLEQPNGQLTVPASVYVPGASTAGTTFLLPHVTLSVSPVMQTGAQPFVWTASGPNMYVNTTSTRPGYVTPWPSGSFCYIGLPPDNTYFGNHVMTMKVDGQTSQTANYQLFFPKNGRNFPNCDATRQINWYHYYNLVYPSPDDDPAIEVDGTYDDTLDQYGSTDWLPPPNYNPGVPYGYGPTGWGAAVIVGNMAGGPASLPIFDLGGPQGLVRFVGLLSVKGIQTYTLTCAHELAHRTLMQDGIYYPYNRSDGPPFGFVDNDGDRLSDTWEAAHHLFANNSDTTGYYATKSVYNYGDTGDLECLCEILAFKELLAKQSLWKQDWSDGGLQFGVVPAPDFYWQFLPAITAGNYTAGTVYKVRTLADLSQAYPTVLSDLP